MYRPTTYSEALAEAGLAKRRSYVYVYIRTIHKYVRKFIRTYVLGLYILRAYVLYIRVYIIN